MKLYNIFILLILCGLCSPTLANKTALTTDNANTTEKQPQLVWIGPGYYDGSWFDTEEDYNDYWAHNNRDRGRHDDKHRRDRDRDHHKDRKKDHHKDKRKNYDKKHRK